MYEIFPSSILSCNKHVSTFSVGLELNILVLENIFHKDIDMIVC